MRTRTDGANNVSAIQLTDRQKIQRGGKQANPCGTTYWMKQQIGDMRVGMNHGGHSAQKQRHTKNQFGVAIGAERRNYASMQNAIDKRRQGDEKSGNWSGCSHIKQR